MAVMDTPMVLLMGFPGEEAALVRLAKTWMLRPMQVATVATELLLLLPVLLLLVQVAAAVAVQVLAPEPEDLEELVAAAQVLKTEQQLLVLLIPEVEAAVPGTMTVPVALVVPVLSSSRFPIATTVNSLVV